MGCVRVFVFFFKQKTAYEMRISDWSSDVCSSDLVDRNEPTVILTVRTETVRRHPGQIAFPGGRIDPEDDGPVDAALREAEEEIGLSRTAVEVKIGRASWRESVCQYV